MWTCKTILDPNDPCNTYNIGYLLNPKVVFGYETKWRGLRQKMRQVLFISNLVDGGIFKYFFPSKQLQLAFEVDFWTIKTSFFLFSKFFEILSNLMWIQVFRSIFNQFQPQFWGATPNYWWKYATDHTLNVSYSAMQVTFQWKICWTRNVWARARWILA